MSAALTPSDLRFLHQVAARRVGEPAATVDDRNLQAAADWPGTEEQGRPKFPTPFARAAALTEAAMRIFPVATQLTGLFVTFCALRLEGYQLAAPQGVLAGMISGLSRERVDVAALSAWLEDRSISAG